MLVICILAGCVTSLSVLIVCFHVQGSEVLSMLYAAHQEGKKTTGVDIEVSLLTEPRELNQYSVDGSTILFEFKPVHLHEIPSF